MITIDKLYTATSDLENIEDGEEMRVEWYKVNTRWEGIDYGQLIENYHLFNENVKSMAEEFVNEFFTSEELLLLELFIKKLGKGDIIMDERSTPIRYIDINTGLGFEGLSQMSNEHNTICLKSWYGDNYDLPFPVHGYYHLYKSYPEDKLRIAADLKIPRIGRLKNGR